VYLTPPASPASSSPPNVKRSRLERLERFKGNAKFRRHQLVCVKRSLKLQEQVDQDEAEAEADSSDSSDSSDDEMIDSSDDYECSCGAAVNGLDIRCFKGQCGECYRGERQCDGCAFFASDPYDLYGHEHGVQKCSECHATFLAELEVAEVEVEVEAEVEVEVEVEAEAEDSDIGEYDTTDPFVNDKEFEELPPMQLGLRPKEQITATRKRKRTDWYAPIEQVDGEPGEPGEYVSEYDESDESDPGSESEYDPNE
jgi:hypothetical protein